MKLCPIQLDFDFKKLDLSTREREEIETTKTERKKSIKEKDEEEVVPETYKRAEKPPAKDEVDASLELKFGKAKVSNRLHAVTRVTVAMRLAWLLSPWSWIPASLRYNACWHGYSHLGCVARSAILAWLLLSWFRIVTSLLHYVC